MKDHRLDFHGTFRRLASFRPSLLQSPLHVDGAPASAPQPNTAEGQSPLEHFLSGVLSGTPEPERLDRAQAVREWRAWLEAYAARIGGERGEWGADADAEREAAMRSANPRFVLRQWVLEEVIQRVERDPESGKRVLAKVLKVRLASRCWSLGVGIDVVVGFA